MSREDECETKKFYTCPRCKQALNYCAKCNKVLTNEEMEKYGILAEHCLVVMCSYCGKVTGWTRRVDKVGVEETLRQSVTPECFERYMAKKAKLKAEHESKVSEIEKLRDKLRQAIDLVVAHDVGELGSADLVDAVNDLVDWEIDDGDGSTTND